MRPCVIVLGALVLASAAPAAAAPPAHPALTHYRAHAVTLVGGTYRRLLHRYGALADQEDLVNVDPIVEGYHRLADSFEDLDARWEPAGAPKGLRVRHRGMGRVFVLFAEAIRIHADALFTRQRDEILAAGPKVEARLLSAAYLQHRWAAALRGALVRAHLSVPPWLAGMAEA